MKLLMRNLIVLTILILSASSTFAEKYPKVNFDENKTLFVNLNDWAGLNIDIEIRDLKGEVLHESQVQKGATLTKKYNLKNLPVGEYELILHSDMKKAIYPIEVTENAVKMLPVENPVVFKPMVAYKKNNIEFNQLALGRTVTFTITDRTGTFFTKTFQNEASINTKFDVTKLPAGNYTVAVIGQNQYDTYFFQK